MESFYSETEIAVEPVRRWCSLGSATVLIRTETKTTRRELGRVWRYETERRGKSCQRWQASRGQWWGRFWRTEALARAELLRKIKADVRKVEGQ